MARLVARGIEGHAYVPLQADKMDFADVDAILAPGMLDAAATYRPGQQIQGKRPVPPPWRDRGLCADGSA
jgi:hypothetical protein